MLSLAHRIALLMRLGLSGVAWSVVEIILYFGWDAFKQV